MRQRLFIIIWAVQFLAFFYLLGVIQEYTELKGISRSQILCAVLSIAMYFVGIIFTWVQQQHINDLEYVQETFPDTLQAALKREPK